MNVLTVLCLYLDKTREYTPLPEGVPEGTPEGERVYLTVYPESSCNTDSISL